MRSHVSLERSLSVSLARAQSITTGNAESWRGLVGLLYPSQPKDVSRGVVVRAMQWDEWYSNIGVRPRLLPFVLDSRHIIGIPRFRRSCCFAAMKTAATTFPVLPIHGLPHRLDLA